MGQLVWLGRPGVTRGQRLRAPAEFKIKDRTFTLRPGEAEDELVKRGREAIRTTPPCASALTASESGNTGWPMLASDMVNAAVRELAWYCEYEELAYVVSDLWEATP